METHRLTQSITYTDRKQNKQPLLPTDSLGGMIQGIVKEIIQETLTNVLEITATIHTAIDELHHKLKAIKTAQTVLAGKIDSLKGQLHNNNTLACHNSDRINQLSATNGSIWTMVTEVSRRVNYMEQQNVDCDVIVSNVANGAEPEDTNDVINKLGLLLKTSVDSSKIKFCTRMNSVNSNRISPILVRFTNWKTKHEFVKQAQSTQIYNHQLGNFDRQKIHDHRRIYVNHRFTAAYQQLDKITREFCTRNDYARWYTRGSFFLKPAKESTPIVVQSVEDFPQNKPA